MTPGSGAEAAFGVTKVISGEKVAYKVEKTFAAAPKGLKTNADGSQERLLKVFKTEEEATLYKEQLETNRQALGAAQEETAPASKKKS